MSRRLHVVILHYIQIVNHYVVHLKVIVNFTTKKNFNKELLKLMYTFNVM